ncbi:MAG: putative toxin-antitoxin system toxin component, PIN family [Deltaproteobacteria bacterium]|nr:putative toxin-antitoxin system toxin component, PIN family [Deltaproteobacteria bacterium]
MKIRVVIDTNVFISALLFEGIVAQLVPLWKQKSFQYLLSKSVMSEYLRVLSYPKFKLTEAEIKYLLEEELLPFVEIVEERKVKVPSLEDPDDEKFLQLATLGKAQYLVSGDNVLLKLRNFKQCQILNPIQFLKLMNPSQNLL